jgi:uroporphyrin-III C-methyltransferase
MMEQGIGKVYIVGAGPGDPELITVKGLRALQNAEVVVYDRLVNQQLLNEASPLAELIYVGKGPDIQSAKQAEIELILISKAQEGKQVVRLKGGDPFVFGRGGEECQSLRENGIPYEVVPGISSALAVPAYAGVPVTHRNMATSFTVVTGHTAGANDFAIEWDALPKKGTLVILMGVAHLPQIAEQLVKYGRSPETAVAMIQQGTTAKQRVITGTLATIAELAQNAGMRSPAITVVGEVASFANEINWFEPNMLIKDPISEFLVTKSQDVTRKQVVPSPIKSGD